MSRRRRRRRQRRDYGDDCDDISYAGSMMTEPSLTTHNDGSNRVTFASLKKNKLSLSLSLSLSLALADTRSIRDEIAKPRNSQNRSSFARYFLEFVSFNSFCFSLLVCSFVKHHVGITSISITNRFSLSLFTLDISMSIVIFIILLLYATLAESQLLMQLWLIHINNLAIFHEFSPRGAT